MDFQNKFCDCKVQRAGDNQKNPKEKKNTTFVAKWDVRDHDFYYTTPF